MAVAAAAASETDNHFFVCGARSSSLNDTEHIFCRRNANERVPCSQLPDIDLRPWIDRTHLHPSPPLDCHGTRG